jgi:YHS domain-containing protein
MLLVLVKKILVLVMILIFGTGLLLTGADKNPINVNKKGIAIKGYDPVAYFTKGDPVKGSAEYQHEWNSAIWYFSSAEHRDMFIAEPEKYAPQYGGYCAYAVSQDETANIDPKSWKIVDGKLYLNLNKRIHRKWEKDIPGYIEKADKNWPGVLKK